ncbi:methyltransferase domain-containing protein [Nocardiopsis sp. B62]|uniref:methyltransferase domain-containing protein n=1 Tax=Nocardiopsis sp. B62 TaxID=2824874 RepID=UPI001B369B8D|nr:methyltransferase domain-containing protein [Nocardiopsis sp. B62]MBQ1082071.1 class I SAM-dependent methyltransferase [Nocardiopsis sp. B62]
MFVSARDFAEYRSMFGLSDDDLSLRILDCPGGAASFTAEARARGSDVTAVDPEYGENRGKLAELALLENEHKHADLVEHESDFVWTWFEGPEQYTRLRSVSARRFGADVTAHPERYVEGSLPHLPFPDHSFDLVLSSHLLFSYGRQLDEEFHREALLELVRLSRWQVRLYPLFQHADFTRYPALDRMREFLADCGVSSRVEPVEYAFDPGDEEMLVLECSERGDLPRSEGIRAHPDPVRWRHLNT